MNYLPPPTPVSVQVVQIAQVLQRCGTIGPSGSVVTPFDGYSALGCSAPIGDGSGGYVRVVPQRWRGPAAIGIEPDQPLIPQPNVYPGITFPSAP